MSLKSSDRDVSVDLMRAFAIVGMVICHTISFLSYYLPEFALSNFIGGQIFGDFPAACFLFVAGLSLSLTLDDVKSGSSDFYWKNRNRKRGLLIFLLGLVFCVLAWGPHQMFIWGILTLAGSSIFILTFLNRLSPTALMALGCGVAGLSPWVREHTHYLDYWGGDFQEVTTVLGSYAKIFVEPVREYATYFEIKPLVYGFLGNGEFAFFPWSAFAILGFAMGRVQYRIQPWRVFSLGLVLICSGFAVAWSAFVSGYQGAAVPSSWIAPLSFYPDSISLFMVQLGVCLIVFSVLRQTFGLKKVQELKQGVGFSFVQGATRISRYTLSIYFFHHFVLLWPIWWFGYQKNDYFFYFGRVMDTPFAFGVAALVLSLSYALTRVWDEYAPRFCLEYWLQRFITRSS